MINSNIDLGQILVTGSILIIGFFLKRELSTITSRLDRHDQMIIKMFGALNRLIGRSGLKLEEINENEN